MTIHFKCMATLLSSFYHAVAPFHDMLQQKRPSHNGNLAANSISATLFGLGVTILNAQRLGLEISYGFSLSLLLTWESHLLNSKLSKVWKIAVLLGIIEDHSPRVICNALQLDKEKLIFFTSLTILDQTILSNNNKGNSMSKATTKSKEKVYNHYTPYQNQVLEEFYSRNPHPDANDRKQLVEALKLTDDRIKYWFQNRRAVYRRKSNKSLNEQLKEKNDILRIEIETLKLTHLMGTCDSCCMEHPEGGFSSSSSSSIECLKLENACMKDMIDKMNKQLEKYSGTERRYSPDPDDGNQVAAEGPSNPGISITEPLSDEIDPDLFFDHNEEAHQSLD